MRIAICTDIYLPQLGGVADSIELVAQELRKNGHTVRIYAPDAPGTRPEADVVRAPAYSIPGSEGTLVLVLPIGMMRDIKRFKPDIIHTHTFSTVGLFAVYAAWRLKVPLVGTDHTFPADFMCYFKLDYRPIRWLVTKFAAWYYNRCAYVTAPSQKMLTELLTYGLTRPTMIISNPVDAELFAPRADRAAVRGRYGISKPTILLFGRIAVEKNLDFALEIVREVGQELDVDLVVIGVGPYEAAFKRKLKVEQLESRTHFLGLLRGQALATALNLGDVFLITSMSETQSMTNLQAMSSGLPVVGIRAGGLPEYIHDGVTGFVVDPTDRASFVAKLKRLLTDPVLAKTYGAAGRQSVMRFAPPAITKKFEMVYNQVYEDQLSHSRS